ncbi:unnamed protein product [Lathyrus oleraceus]
MVFCGSALSNEEKQRKQMGHARGQ